MTNPWEEIRLDEYEKHMSLDSVKQLQTLDMIMQEQFSAYKAETAEVLGIAGGNGLEHIRKYGFRKVYGIDINADYINETTKRYADLSGILECIKADIISETEKLPKAQLLIADLLIEYIGYSVFGKAVAQIEAEYVSCVIQVNADEKQWVSDSPYIHAFDRLDEVHHQIEENALAALMNEIGYLLILHEKHPLPNGKALIRMDFQKRH